MGRICCPRPTPSTPAWRVKQPPPPTDDTPPDLAGAQRQLTVLQWVIPGLTGTALVLNALMGEQQRPQQVTSGLLRGLRSRLPVLALAGTGLWVRLRSRGTPTR